MSSMEGMSILKEVEARNAKRQGAGEQPDGKPDLEGMELGEEGNLDAELGLDGDGGDDDHAIRGEDAAEKVRRFYQVSGRPDFFNFSVHHPETLDTNTLTRTENDFFLDRYKPTPFFGSSLTHLQKQFAGFARKSGFDKKTMQDTEFAQLYQPKHATNQGMKGLGMYTHASIMHCGSSGGGMSQILNISLTAGCPAQCAFCKESLLGRNYTQADFNEETGILRIKMEDGKEVDVLGKVRVKFWDPKAETVVYGPLQVAIFNGYPIAKDSLEKLKRGELVRYLAD